MQIDFGGSLPTWLTKSCVNSSLRSVAEIQEYFQELRKMEDYDADDGKALGVRLMHPGEETGKKPWQKVRDVDRTELDAGAEAEEDGGCGAAPVEDAELEHGGVVREI